MAKIYSVPSQVKVPEFNWKNIEQYNKDCDKFKEELKQFLLKRKTGKNIGEIIRFQVADGYAEYMVASTSPVELIHLPLMDEYHSETAPLMTAKAIQQKLDQEKALAKIFGGK